MGESNTFASGKHLELESKKILITGASRGLGLATACAFAAEGASLMLCARNEDTLKQAQELVSDHLAGSATVNYIVADVSAPDQVADAVETTVDKLGGLDVLFANAGVYGPKGPIESVNMDEWIKALNINLLGVV